MFDMTCDIQFVQQPSYYSVWLFYSDSSRQVRLQHYWWFSLRSYLDNWAR